MKKNFLWILVRLHASEKQSVPSRTGFNILVRNDQEVVKDDVGYLPTINAPAKNMSTVYQVLTKCLQIKNTLNFQSIVVVFDQALYAKADKVETQRAVQGSCAKDGCVPYYLYLLVSDRDLYLAF